MSELKLRPPDASEHWRPKPLGRACLRRQAEARSYNSADDISQRQNGGGAVQLRQAFRQDIALNF
jgi:hypothetical protein